MEAMHLIVVSLLLFFLCFTPAPSLAEYSIEIPTLIQTDNTINAYLSLNDPKSSSSQYGTPIQRLKFEVNYRTKSIIEVKIYPVTQISWQVPFVASDTANLRPSTGRDYQFTFQVDPFAFRVLRSSQGPEESIFSSDAIQSRFLTFTDKYIEISTSISKRAHFFGLGERNGIFELNRSANYTLWALDNFGIPVNQNLYGAHPFFLNFKNKEPTKSESASGVFLLNSNAMDVALSQDFLTYKLTGGILDFYFFLGPSPDQVIAQYLQIIGNPLMIPYWSLGFHQCRYGYSSIQEVQSVVQSYEASKIPLETMWIDIDYMDQFQDFTFDPVNFPEASVRNFVNDLHSKGQRFIPIVDPGIATGSPTALRGAQQQVFVQNQARTDFQRGIVWPGEVYFPDWLHPNATSFWTNELSLFYQKVPYDGLWIDMNEPANFQTDPSTLAGYYPVNNGGSQQPLNWKTIDVAANHYTSIHFNVHNIYGHLEGLITKAALDQVRTGKRSLIISRSTFPGSGRYVGHWLGDNTATWDDLKNSIPGILNFNFFGIPFVGADICGFAGNTTEELCARWMQLGAFYPFARNHNMKDAIPQEPYLWPLVLQASIAALNIRYLILPYYYTLFYLANQAGSTVLRPLFFEFPGEETDSLRKIWQINEQFLIGDSLLLSPVLQQSAEFVSAYLPTSAIWYQFSSGVRATSGWNNLSVGYDDVNLHVRGGRIIPTQLPAMTTRDSLKNPYGLVIALDLAGQANGILFIDDGESVDSISSGKSLVVQFSLTTNELEARFASQLLKSPSAPLNLPNLDRIKVFGFPDSVKAIVTSRNVSLPFVSLYNPETKVLEIQSLSLSLETAFQLVIEYGVPTSPSPPIVIEDIDEINPTVMAIGILVGVVVLVAIVLFALYWRRKRQLAKFEKIAMRLMEDDEDDQHASLGREAE